MSRTSSQASSACPELSTRITLHFLFLFLLTLVAACGDHPTEAFSPENVSTQLAAGRPDAELVSDLASSDATASSVTLQWTTVGDGNGNGAWYEIRYAASPLESWSGAAVVETGDCASPIKSNDVGTTLTCVVDGLDPATSYDLQVASFRRGGAFETDTRVLSDVVTATTGETDTGTDSGTDDGATDDGSIDDGSTDDGSTDDGSTDGTANESPTAVIAASCSDLTCALDGTGSTDSDGTLADYAWDFGDGSTGSGSQVEHTYFSAGTYDVRLVVTDDAGATDTATTSVTVEEPVTTDPSGGEGIWVSPTTLASLSTSGTAWSNLESEANGSCGSVDLSDQDDDTNVCVMAKGLAFAGTGQSSYRSDVVTAVREIVGMGTYDGRALALGRELVSYVIAADLVDLKNHDPSLDGDFRAKLRELLTTYTHSGPDNLVECHEERPNNWGTHCGASRAAVAAYLGDTAELDRVATVFKGWLGDRSSYAGFKYGDLSWQCDQDRPVGINPAGCTIDGHPVDGVLPDDQRRGGGFTWPPPAENYVWEGLQGALAQAVVLHRAGYDVFQWEDRALLRAVTWLHEQASYPAEGDDTWQPHLVNHFYGTSFPAPTSNPGKNVGWTDWTHG